MTPEQKAQRYDEALERASIWQKHLYDTNDKDYADELNYIFPELKKSEDEKIKDDLIEWIDDFPDPIWRGHYKSDIIAWLEKQGEQNLIMANLPQLGEQKSDNSYCQENCKGFQETGKCFADGDCKAKRKVKSIYEVKPKFKIGDWICNDVCDVHIASIENGMYYFDEGDGLSIVFADERYHLWTIQDARDGDVLQLGKVTAIFKEFIEYGNCKCYCSICNGEFEIPSQDGGDNSYGYHNAIPATKEQRDLLFQKMKESRYTFDFEKKELKKIENEITIPFGAKDSDLQEATYYIPKGFHAEIDGDKVIIKKEEKPTVWSEEDEKRLNSCLSILRPKTLFGNTEITNIETINTKWLKSLKQRIGG